MNNLTNLKVTLGHGQENQNAESKGDSKASPSGLVLELTLHCSANVHLSVVHLYVLTLFVLQGVTLRAPHGTCSPLPFKPAL
jgi:hypothetical protein